MTGRYDPAKEFPDDDPREGGPEQHHHEQLRAPKITDLGNRLRSIEAGLDDPDYTVRRVNDYTDADHERMPSPPKDTSTNIHKISLSKLRTYTDEDNECLVSDRFSVGIVGDTLVITERPQRQPSSSPERSSDGDAGTDKSRDEPKLERIALARYDSEEIPPREWGVRDRFPLRNVALLSGEGAIGKSLLFLQLAVAHVLGRDWLRSLPEKGPVVLVNCEDEEAELVRRLQPILRSCNASFGEVAPDLHIFSLSNRDPLLAWLSRGGRILPTPLYRTLLEIVTDIRPICIIIDNVADVFGGSEIDRSQVRQFVTLMRQLALASSGYVIMSAHPSLTGIASKSGLSGSTQWHNSVRARAYLRLLTENNREDTAATGIRVLEFMKSNYSRLAECIEPQWCDGLYLPVKMPTAPEQAAARAAADAMFLKLLEKAARKGENLSPKPTANNYAPTVFAKTPEARTAHLGRDHFEQALERLIDAGRIASEPYGAASRGTSRIISRRLV